MKNLIISVFLLTSVSCFATVRDSTFHRHVFSVSMANGVSQMFFDGPDHRPTNKWTSFSNGEGVNITYVPMYTVHVQLHYSLGISSMVRIETGIGYLLSGVVHTENFTFMAPYSSQEIFKTYFYLGSITLPLYVKFTKPLRHGAFTCTFGPDFWLPVHNFYKNTDINLPPYYHIPVNGHYRFTTSNTTQSSNMGFCLKMAYEKQLKSNLSINIGPVVDFFRLVQFHPFSSNGYYPYQFYAGLDVAVNFGLKRKKGK